MRIIEDTKLDFSDVLLVPKRSTLQSRIDVDLIKKYKFKYSSFNYEGTPIMVANMDHTGTIAMARALLPFKMDVALHKFHTQEQLHSIEAFDNCWQTIGTIDSVDNIVLWFICIDVANGYSEKLSSKISAIREKYPQACIMAGNVVTPDMVYELIQKGADIVKIGIGPGRACTTRSVTGVGYPQLSAIMECADAAHGIGGHICADGGITCSGDIAKGFAAGADFVMAGAIFAGHEECEGQFRGMSSREAMIDHYGEKKDYRAAEGKTIQAEPKGSVKETCEEILGGLRSACTYVGASNLKDLPKCATFVKVNRQK